MPTYEYQCKACHHRFEIVQSFSEDSLTVCPECQGALKKIFGNVGITFKGSGFYKTDSRSASSATKTASSDSGSGSSGSGSDSSGSSSSGSSDSSSSSSSASSTGSSSSSGSPAASTSHAH